MKRHEALADLSRDHHHGLVAAKRMRERAEEGSHAEVREEAQRFLAFWEEELADHFTEEEHVLLPIYQRHGALREDDGVLRMLEEHAWFRDAVPKLADALEEGEDVRARLAQMGETLAEHARFEDRELFVRIEQTLSEEELALLHDRSVRFRRAHRGEEAIGPRTTREG